MILASSLHRTSQHRDCSNLKINSAELDLPIHSFSSKRLVRAQAEGNFKQFLRCEVASQALCTFNENTLQADFRVSSPFITSITIQFSKLPSLHITLFSMMRGVNLNPLALLGASFIFCVTCMLMHTSTFPRVILISSHFSRHSSVFWSKKKKMSFLQKQDAMLQASCGEEIDWVASCQGETRACL